MRRDFRGGTEGREAEIAKGDLAEIESCEAILAAFTAADEGTAMEAWYARSRGKRVIAYTGGTRPIPGPSTSPTRFTRSSNLRFVHSPTTTAPKNRLSPDLCQRDASNANPAALDEFLRRANPAVVASLRRDGSPHTVATWYDGEDNRALLNMDESRLRLRFMRRDPRVALTVLDDDGWRRHVSLLGRIVSLDEDVDLQDIDRLARR
jgi:PPOX class probable F420-dependent enzyme